ncbi:hypothetical protein [Klebsiella variicola]|uniref:hypothetical protein n=1 Tax=Klebsiella variicola TaxID=244366 RepID=UPI002407766A|nr:hypothetical protein [Klebsiella variicola]MDG0490083.1 hypothetical protein [Klebsiella variicola]
MGWGFLKEFAKHIEHTAISQPKAILTDVAHGNFSKAFGDWKSTFGQNERDLQGVFQKAGIGGWVGKHPQESIGALVATIFGGWAAAGAYGAGAGGTAAGAAGTGATGAAGGSGIAAGTVVGQTVPAIPSVASMTSGTGAAVTATPSYSILAAPGYGTGGSWATTLGGETPVANTGFSTASSWMDKAKQYYDTYQKVNQFTQQGQQNQQQNNGPEMMKQDLLPFQPIQTAASNPQNINGINLLTDQNNVPNFTGGGSFGGF